jgi:hypothetical protein
MAYVPGSYNTAQATNYNYISTLDVHKPEFDNELTKRFGSQLLTGLMDMVGRKKPVSAKEYFHFEEDRIMPKVKPSVVGGGAGALGTFTMPANNSTSYTATSPYIVASPVVTTTGYPVQKGDIIRIPASATAGQGDIQVFVTAVTLSAGTFIAYPIISTVSIPTIAPGSEIEMPVLYNAHAEASGMPESLDTKVTKFVNNLQIIKAKYEISATEANVQTWIDFEGPNGEKWNGWKLKGEKDTYIRYQNNKEMALLLGQKITNTTLITALGFDGQQTQITEGLIPSIKSQGLTLSYSSITGLTLADVDTYIRSADKQKAARENWVYNGINLRPQWSDLLIDITKEGGVSYGAFGGGVKGKDLAINLDFDAIKRNGYTFYLKTYDVFNDLQTLGSDNFTFVDEAMIIPADEGRDPQTGDTIPSLRVRYLQAPNGSESRDMKHWLRDVTITNKDTWEANYECEMGFEGFAMQRFGYAQKL